MSALGSTPERIKPAEFARAGLAVAGAIPVSAFKRLGEQLTRHDGQLDYALVGELTERGHDALSLKVSGTVWLKCQRCLEAVAVAIDSSRRVVFAKDADEVETAYEADDTDVVDAVEAIEVTDLIEDEVLLSMPSSPKHEIGACEAAVCGAGEVRKSPFLVLAKFGRNPPED